MYIHTITIQGGQGFNLHLCTEYCWIQTNIDNKKIINPSYPHTVTIVRVWFTHGCGRRSKAVSAARLLVPGICHPTYIFRCSVGCILVYLKGQFFWPTLFFNLIFFLHFYGDAFIKNHNLPSPNLHTHSIEDDFFSIEDDFFSVVGNFFQVGSKQFFGKITLYLWDYSYWSRRSSKLQKKLFHTQ